LTVSSPAPSREFPALALLAGVSRLAYARLPKSSRPVVAHDEDPRDLRDQIRRVESEAGRKVRGEPGARRPRPPVNLLRASVVDACGKGPTGFETARSQAPGPWNYRL